MAKGRRVSGIFVPIQLDTSLVEQDLSKLKDSFGQTITAMQKGMANALSSYKLGVGLVDLNRALGQIRDGATALSRVRISEFTKSIQSADSELKKLAETFGGTSKQQEQMLVRLAETQAVNQQVSALRTLQKHLGMTAEEAVRFARSMGLAVSDTAMVKATGQSDLTQQLSKISEEYRKLSSLSGSPLSNEGFKNFLDTNRIKAAVDAYQKLYNGQKLTKEGFEQIAAAAGVSKQQVANYVAELEKAGQVRRGWAGVFTPSNMAAGVQSGLSALGVVGGMYGAAELTKSAYQSSLKMENIELAFQSIFSSSTAAGEQIEYVRELTDKLGLSFLDASEGAKKLFAAARGTEVEKDAQDIFEAFSTMGAALKLSGSEMESVFLAVSQMISKGKVSAEELRLQLAERMPGAVNLFAKSIGVTTVELDKMLQEGKVGLDALRSFAGEVQKTYESGADKASRGLQAELNRTANAWFNLKKAFVDTQGSADALRSVSSALEGIAQHAEFLKDATAQLVKLAGAFTVVSLAVKGVKAFKDAAGGGKYFTFVATKMISALKLLSSALLGPVGILTTFAFALAEFYTATDRGVEALEKMGGSVEGYTKRLKQAVEAQKDFNSASLDYARRTVQDSLSSAQLIFAPDRTEYSLRSGMPYTVRSGLSKQLDDLKTFFGSESNAVISKAQAFSQKLGKDFFSGFNVSENLLRLDPEMAQDQLNSLEEYLKTAARRLDSFWEELKAKGASTEVLDAYRSNVDGSLKALEDLIQRQRELIDLQKKSSESEVTFNAKEYKNAINEIEKATKNIKLFSTEDEKKEVEGLSNLIGDLLENLTSLSSAMETGGLSGEEYTKQIDLGKDALERFAAKAAESGVNADEFISLLISKVPLGIDQIATLYSYMQRIANLDLSKGVADFVKNLNTKTALLGEKAVVSDVYKFLEDKGVKQTGEDLVKVIKSGNLGILEFKNGAKLSAEEIGKINTALEERERKQNSVNAEKSASKAAKSYESIEKAIERLNRQVETWNVKTKESSIGPVDVQLSKYNDEIDRLLRNGKATSDQVRRLQEVKVALNEAAAAYQDYILKREKEKALDFYKSAADDYSKITGVVDPTVIQKSAQTVYEKQLEEARKFLEAKVLTQEEYNQLEVMLDAKKNDEIRRNSQDLYDNLMVSIDDYYAKYRNFATGIGDVMTTAMDGISSAIADFATTGIQNFDNLGQAFADLANNILSMVNRLLSQQLVSSLFSFATGFFNVGGLGSKATSTMAANGMVYSGGSSGWLTGVHGHAKGGAFTGSSLSAYSGSIVSTPTLFSMGTPIPAYAKGAGLMGEAGPEAVMPLVRTPSGHLGVRAENNAGVQQNVVINFIDKVGVDVKQKESRDSQGNVRLDLYLEQRTAEAMARQGSPISRVLNNTYGARPALANR